VAASDGKVENPRPPVGRSIHSNQASRSASTLPNSSGGSRTLGTRRSWELCRAKIADVSRDDQVIALAGHKTARKTGQARCIPAPDRDAFRACAQHDGSASSLPLRRVKAIRLVLSSLAQRRTVKLTGGCLCSVHHGTVEAAFELCGMPGVGT
jgi:hypothetical protein